MYDAPVPDESVTLPTAAGAAAVVRRYGGANDVRLLVSHGNGFAADGYREFWEPLADHFEIIVFDQRNHGLNPASPAEHHDYEHIAEDLEYIARGVNEVWPEKPAYGVFHSLSARAAMMQALRSEPTWDGLVLFDPPTVAPFESTLRSTSVRYDTKLAEWAPGRGSEFDDPEELVREYRRAGPSRNWTDRSQRAMANAVLKRDAASGRYHLRCPGVLEARLYRQNSMIRIWPSAAEIGCPVLLVGSDPGPGQPNPTGDTNRLLAEQGGFRFTALRGTGHLMQLEQPAACARLAQAFIVETEQT